MLESRFSLDILKRPESIGLLVRERYPSLSRARCIDDDAIKSHTLVGREKVSCVDLPSLYDRRSLELAVIDELIIADLILLKRDDLPCIAHEHCHLCGLGSWSCTDIEESLSLFWCKHENRKHRRE